MASQTIQIGMVGYQFMGRVHSSAWLQVPRFFSELPLRPVLHTLCGRNAARVREAAAVWGWARTAADYRQLVRDPEIQLVDVAVPNNAHAEVVLAAAEAGKAVICEKPLACNLRDARAMVAAVQQAGVPHFVWFNYRRVPAIALARQLIDSGRLGRVYHVRAHYLQDWLHDPNTAGCWRLSREHSGSGALGDLAAHSIDLTRYLLNDEFEEVCGMLTTFTPRRPSATGDQLVPVDVDDATAFLARLRSGAMATFEASRCATGHANGNTIEINGERGAIRFHFPDFNHLEFYDAQLPEAELGWRRISATRGRDPYSGRYWPTDHGLGYAETFINTAADVLASLASGGEMAFHADFVDGLRCQEVLEAVSLSMQHRQWIRLAEIA